MEGSFAQRSKKKSFCIFEDDLGGLNAVQEMILTWAKIGSGSSLPHVVRPRIIAENQVMQTMGERNGTE
jgi:hypothetical protein